MIKNIFAAIGIYHTFKFVYKYARHFVCKVNEKMKEIESREKLEEKRKSVKWVLGMYRDGYSRQEIKLVCDFVAPDITDVMVDQICDDEDRFWSASA